MKTTPVGPLAGKLVRREGIGQGTAPILKRPPARLCTPSSILFDVARIPTESAPNARGCVMYTMPMPTPPRPRRICNAANPSSASKATARWSSATRPPSAMIKAWNVQASPKSKMPPTRALMMPVARKLNQSGPFLLQGARIGADGRREQVSGPAVVLQLALFFLPVIAVFVIALTDWQFGTRTLAFVGLADLRRSSPTRPSGPRSSIRSSMC
ncbi:hypothetical protein [Bradyrhizobium sp. B120]|uniref:hypothetical protein n=1 Tax=Bradyrhizobium sp. B120 TaxID=3410088 RepID=UPI003B97DE58